MRASRLVGLLSLLQARGRMSTQQLAAELEVSPRTILRDIEALSTAGIPVYATRGRHGGFQLLDGYTSDLPAYTTDPPGFTGEVSPPAVSARPGTGSPAVAVPWARLRLSPRGRRLTALLGRPSGLHIRRGGPSDPDRPGWVEVRLRIGSPDALIAELLALGPEVEVLAPASLRDQIARTASQITALHASPAITSPAQGQSGQPEGA